MLGVTAKMLSFAVLVNVWATFALAQESEIMVSDNKTQCINQMVEWCNNMQYPQEGAGLAVLSITFEDPKGFYHVFCSSDSDGTNCTKSSSPWFSCNTKHVFTYKEKIVSNETAASDVDDDICKTADKAFNDLFIQNLSYDNTTLKEEIQKGMETFLDRIAQMEEQIQFIQRVMKSYLGGFWDGFNDGFMPRDSITNTTDSDSTTTLPDDSTQTSTDKTNQIEKE